MQYLSKQFRETNIIALPYIYANFKVFFTKQDNTQQYNNICGFIAFWHYNTLCYYYFPNHPLHRHRSMCKYVYVTKHFMQLKCAIIITYKLHAPHSQKNKNQKKSLNCMHLTRVVQVKLFITTDTFIISFCIIFSLPFVRFNNKYSATCWMLLSSSL